jgi:membrane protein
VEDSAVKRVFQLLKEAFTEFQQDKALRLGAALAYYTIFSIAPLLLIAIAIVGLTFGRSQAQAQSRRAASSERRAGKISADRPARRPPLAGGGGGLKLLLGGCAGFFVGALLGLVSGFILLFKSLKKFFT